jgi:hypothetical protein
VSAARGAAGEFATLTPLDGDAFLRVQRIGTDQVGVHLDVHADDVRELSSLAVSLGASVETVHGHSVLRSPARFGFCVVPQHGERVRPHAARATDGARALVDQITIDVPSSAFGAEVEFWSAFTGCDARSGARSEFSALTRPEGMPLRILLHRLGVADPRSTATAHLDLACGSDIDRVVAWHRSIGAASRASRAEDHDHLVTGGPFTTLRDPNGLAYCLTRRDPVSGLLPESW